MKLATRIAVGSSAVVVLMGLLTIGSLHALIRSSLRRQASDAELTLTRMAAERLADPLLDGSWVKVQGVLDDLAAASPSVAYAYVIDPMNRRVLHTFPRGLPRELASANRLSSKESPSVQWRVLMTENGIVRDVAVRVIDGLDAELHVGFGERMIATSVRAVARTIAVLTLVGVIVGTAVALALGRRISKPLEAVTDHARRLANGEFGIIEDRGSTDEVGDLARAFNNLSINLDSTMAALQRRNRELSAVNAVATAAAAPDDVLSGMQRALTDSLAALNLRVGWIVLREGASSRVAAACGFSGEVVVHASFGSECACARVIATGEAVVLRMPPRECFADSILPFDGTEIASHAAVPVMVKGRVFGAVAVASASQDGLASEDLALLRDVARQMGVALETKRLWDELEAKERSRADLLAKLIGAQEEERRRIARELHDETGQTLNSIVLGLRAAEQMLAVQSPAALVHIAALKKTAAEGVRELQNTIYDLRPSVLDDLGLVPSLRWLVETRFAGCEIAHALHVDGAERRLPLDVETTLFRVSQEALSNVVRHASATSVTITLGLWASEATLEVADDGVGFGAETFSRPGYDGRGLGLLGMRERVEILGGECSIDSREGNGTRIRVRVPVPV